MVRIPHLDKYPEVKSLVKQSGAFIDDARTLYGIINEFRIYSGILQSRLALPQQKILAIVIYKNLFPKDFALLQYGRGFLGGMLNNVDHLREIHETPIRKRIDEINDKIRELDELLITELQVLDGAFVDIPLEWHRNNSSLGRSGFEYISSVQAGKEQNSSYQAISYEDIKKELRKKNGYARREQQIKGLSSDRISRLEKEKTEELERIEKSHSKSIAQILAEAPDCYDELVSHIEKEGEYKLDVCESIKSTRKEPLIRIFLEASTVCKDEIEALSSLGIEFLKKPLFEIPEKVKAEVIDANLFFPSPECFKYAINHARLDIPDSGYMETDQLICYSDVIKAGSKNMADYLQGNLDRFIERYLEKADSERNIDDEDSAIYILNNLKDPELKTSYLEQLPYQVTQIVAIADHSFWAEAIELSKVKCTLANSVAYYLKYRDENTKVIPEELLNFISKNAYSDSTEALPHESDINDFLVSLLDSDLSDDMGLPFLLSARVAINFSFGEIAHLQKERLDLLANNGLIDIHSNNLETLREYDEDLVGVLVQSHLKDYIDMLGKGWEPTERELQGVIEGERYIPLKKKVLDNSDLLVWLSTEISPELYELIIRDHFHDEDIPFLIKHYNQFTSAVKAASLYQVLTHKVETLDADSIIPDELISDIVATRDSEDAWDNVWIKTLLVKTSQYASRQTLIDAFTARGFIQEARCLQGFQESFESTEQNKEFLQHLKNRELISSFKPDRHHSGRLRSFPKRT